MRQWGFIAMSSSRARHEIARSFHERREHFEGLRRGLTTAIGNIRSLALGAAPAPCWWHDSHHYALD